jgi:hypothetical protein
MKALSWKEPYASLMLHGKIETRTWSTNYRGQVLICASQKPYSDLQTCDISGEIQSIRISDTLFSNEIELTRFKNGFAFAVGELVDCRPMTIEDEDKCFVQYRPGLWCHIYENVRELEYPIFWKGSQRWKNVPEDIVKSLIYKK